MSIYTDTIAIALDMRPMTNEEYRTFIDNFNNDRTLFTKIPSQNKGKTYEELYGIEKANWLKQNTSEKNKGRVVSEEVKEKLRQANKKQFENAESRKTHLEGVLKSNGNHKGKCWINDGKTNKRVEESHAINYIKNGWSSGRILGEVKFYEFSKPRRDVISGKFLKKDMKDGN